MNRFALTFIALLTVSACAIAQDPYTGKATETVPQDLGLRTVVGCLSNNNGIYVLAGGGPGPKQFRIVSGDLDALKGQNGHTIKVVGMVAKNDPVEEQHALFNAGSTTGVGYLTIEAQKVTQVYDNCSAIGQEWSGDHK